FFFQAEDGIRDFHVTGVQTCALPICAYLWTNSVDGGRLERLSTDHSYVQMLLESGAITNDELENHPEKNIITQCIGSQESDDLRSEERRVGKECRSGGSEGNLEGRSV